LNRPLATMAVLALALAACGSPATTTAEKPKVAYELTTQTPAAKGDIDSFTWSLFAEPFSLDYVYAFDFPPNQVLSNVCESLFRWNPDLTTSPALATGSTNPTPTTWVYTIRDGVKFHDGTTLTAKDVAVSLNRHLNPEIGSYWASAFQNVESVKETGPLEVTITLKRPDALINQYMASAPGIISSAASMAKAGKDYGSSSGGLNCTGPFSFGSWNPGQSIVLKRFDGYWDPTLKAKSAEVKFTFLADPSARVNAFKTGEVDGGWLLPTNSFDTLKDAGKVYFGKNTTTSAEIIGDLTGALSDVRVRRALLMATDRAGIIKAGAGGVAEIADTFTPRSVWGDLPNADANVKDVPTYAYDVAAAKKLAEEAGAVGKKVVIATTPISVETNIITQGIAAAATAIGLKPEIKNITGEQYGALFIDPAARKGVDLFLTFWYTSVTDPMEMYGTLQTGDFANYGNWSNPEFDAAAAEAIGAYDPAAHSAATAKAQKIVLTELPWLPLYSAPTSLFMGKKITGVMPSIAYMYYPWAATIGAAN